MLVAPIGTSILVAMATGAGQLYSMLCGRASTLAAFLCSRTQSRLQPWKSSLLTGHGELLSEPAHLNGEEFKVSKWIKEGGDRPLQARGKMEQTGNEHEPGKTYLRGRAPARRIRPSLEGKLKWRTFAE